MGALKEFHLYPLSPHGGEGSGEGEVNLFSALFNISLFALSPFDP
jgi:hypothetical protein